MRSGKWNVIVGSILLCLAMFNIMSMMTVYHNHSSCLKTSRSAEDIFQGQPDQEDYEEIEESNNLKKTDDTEDKWQQQFHKEDQMAGLLAPPAVENHEAGRARVYDRERQRLEEAHANQRATRGVHSTDMTLISELNDTVHDWPWPESRDTHSKCRQRHWGVLDKMPDVSVIITFHDSENISHLVRTIHSIVQRTPPLLLKEIILVGDYTQKDDLGELLRIYTESVFGDLVKLLRSSRPLGLIKARLVGVEHAAGQVLVAMDSHMEVQHNWLEPLLYEIQQNRRTLASSFLDWMEVTDEGRWKYRHGGSSWITYFDWAFTFGFQALAAVPDNSTHAIRSPVTVGGMFAIEKNFFEDIGGYDEKMTRWGGENVDLALRVWMCGGRVINVPCSHAAHYESPTSRSYRDSWTQDIQKNYKRVAEVWLDDYKKYFYQMYPNLKSVNVGDLTDRISIRRKCKRDFSWVLNNVIPQLGIPDVDSIAYGGLESLAYERNCLDTRDLRTPGLVGCSQLTLQSQGFYWSLSGHIRMPMHIYNVVPQIDNKQVLVLEEMTGFTGKKIATKWFHIKNGFVIDTKSGLCLQGSVNSIMTMAPCSRKIVAQRWRFRYYNHIYDQLLNSQTNSQINKDVIDSFSPYFNLLREGENAYGHRRNETTFDAFRLRRKRKLKLKKY